MRNANDDHDYCEHSKQIQIRNQSIDQHDKAIEE